MAWPARRSLDLSGAAVPIIQAPMAGAGGVELAVAAMQGGAVGSLPCAMPTPEQVVEQAAQVRARAAGPLNLNFFCHTLGPQPDDSAWRALLVPFYTELGIIDSGEAPPLRRPFDAAIAEAVASVRPKLVSFHFGPPQEALLARVRGVGAKVLGNATTFDEGCWLASAGCDAIIVQGQEAGGHAGYFLANHRPQPLLALVRELRAAISTPLIAAGGMTDGGAIAAALRAGAEAVQIGTAYLACPESLIGPEHRARLGTGAETLFTNVMTGRPARGFRNRLVDALGPLNPAAPPFPYAGNALAPLQARSRGDFGPLWAGAGAGSVRPMPARELTEQLAREALQLLGDTP